MANVGWRAIAPANGIGGVPMASRSRSRFSSAHPVLWRLFILFSILSLSGLMPLAGAMPAAAQNQVIIGLITKTDTNPFFVKMKQGFEAEAKKYNAKTMTAA